MVAGNGVAIEVHIRMDGAMTLTDSHHMTSQVEQKLKDHFGSNTHVVIHTEPNKS